MKPTELAARNRSGGFWAATGNPTVVDHAIVGHVRVDRVVQLVVPADGAARITTSLDLLDWQQTFDLLGRTRPTELIRRVRGAESADPDGTRWPRNKTSDDATSSTSGEATAEDRTSPRGCLAEPIQPPILGPRVVQHHDTATPPRDARSCRDYFDGLTCRRRP